MGPVNEAFRSKDVLGDDYQVNVRGGLMTRAASITVEWRNSVLTSTHNSWGRNEAALSPETRCFHVASEIDLPGCTNNSVVDLSCIYPKPPSTSDRQRETAPASCFASCPCMPSNPTVTHKRSMRRIRDRDETNTLQLPALEI